MMGISQNDTLSAKIDPWQFLQVPRSLCDGTFSFAEARSPREICLALLSAKRSMPKDFSDTESGPHCFWLATSLVSRDPWSLS
jgi:hypothetical protein